MTYLLLDGIVGDVATSPDSAVVSVTGDIDIRIRLAADDWTPATFQYLFTKYGDSGTRSWRLFLEGNLDFRHSANGAADVGSANSPALGFTDGTTHWVRVTMDVDNGASQREIKFWTADGSLENPDAADFSQIGSTVTGPVTSIFDGTADIGIGGNTGVAATNPFAGKIYRAQIYDGIDGTLVFDGDPSDPNTWDCPDKLFFTDKANSATVTLQGDASLVGDCPSGNRMGGTGAIRKPPRY